MDLRVLTAVVVLVHESLDGTMMMMMVELLTITAVMMVARMME